MSGRVLALDIAMVTGWAFLIDGEVQGHGIVDLRAPDKDIPRDEGDRENVFRAAVAKALHKGKINMLVIERPVLSRPSHTTYRTNGMCWTAHGAAYEAKVERREVTADTWRKALYGRARPVKGRTLKQMAVAYVEKMGFTVQDDNEGEAILIGLWWHHHGSKDDNGGNADGTNDTGIRVDERKHSDPDENVARGLQRAPDIKQAGRHAKRRNRKSSSVEP